MNVHPSNHTDPLSLSNQLRVGGSNNTRSHYDGIMTMSDHDVVTTSTSPYMSHEMVTVAFVLLIQVAYLYQWNSRRSFFHSCSIVEAVQQPRFWYRLAILSLFSNSSHRSWTTTSTTNPSAPDSSAMNQNQQQQQEQQWWWLSFVMLLYQVHLIWSCRAVEGFYYPYFGLALLAWIAINQALVALAVQRWFLMTSSSSAGAGAAVISSSSVGTSTTVLSMPWTTTSTSTTSAAIPATISMLVHQGVGGGVGCTSLTITWLVVFSHLFQHVGIPVVPLDPLVSLSTTPSLSSTPFSFLPPPRVSRRLCMILLTALHVFLVHDRITASSPGMVMMATDHGVSSRVQQYSALLFKIRCWLACILQPLVGWITGKLWTLGVLDFLVEPYWGGWLFSFLLLVSLLSSRPHWEPMPGLVIWSAALSHSSKEDDDNDDDDDDHHNHRRQLASSHNASNTETHNSTRDFLPQRESIYGRLPEFNVLEVDADDDDDDDDDVDYDPGNDDEEQVIRRSLLRGAVRSRRGRVEGA
jgi:hypothetical protein